MEYPIGELLDRYSILLLKKERLTTSDSSKELEDFKNAIMAKGFNQDDIEEYTRELYKHNGDIWDLESAIRQGREGELGLEEVGRRAIEIRKINEKRVACKNDANEFFKEGYAEVKHTVGPKHLWSSKPSVAIIGALGVGAAHAIACERLGYNVAYIVDTNIDEAVRRFGGKEWINKWGDIEEKVTAKSSPEIITPYNFFSTDKQPVDIAIIATPDSTHHGIIKSIDYHKLAKVIMCEKPLSLPSEYEPSFSKVYVGHKWLVNPDVREELQNNVISISQTHQYPPPRDGWRKDNEVLFDLGSHLLASALYSFSYKFRDEPAKFDYLKECTVHLVTYGRDICSFVVEARGHRITCTMGYRLQDKGISGIHGYASNMSVYDAEVFVNGKGFPWRDDLFELEIAACLKGESYLADIKMGWSIDVLLGDLKDQSESKK